MTFQTLKTNQNLTQRIIAETVTYGKAEWSLCILGPIKCSDYQGALIVQVSYMIKLHHLGP